MELFPLTQPYFLPLNFQEIWRILEIKRIRERLEIEDATESPLKISCSKRKIITLTACEADETDWRKVHGPLIQTA